MVFPIRVIRVIRWPKIFWHIRVLLPNSNKMTLTLARHRRFAWIFIFLFAVSCGWCADQPREVTLTVDTKRPTAEFDPRSALGGGLDGHWQGEEERMLSPANVRRMLEAGLGPVSYRLRTELAVEAWHWNPRGRWSDPQLAQGYWTSDAEPRRGQPILLSYGYKLPRRGNTHDEANDDSYSMLDDGDPATFWKSNPYLAEAYTGEPDARHPGWVVIDFEKEVPINALRIHWGDPYATRFDVEYATRGCVFFGGHPAGTWKRFEHGRFTQATGGDALLHLADRPVMARYLRLWMTASSGTPAAGGRDARDRQGFAIRELSAGWCDAAGAFHDRIVHQPGPKQTLTYVSSTDPWHRAMDRDPRVEQPGIDRVFRCGITRGLPAMLAVPVLYDTPENALAFTEYIRRSGYPVARYELGEEPDGQRVDPRDFAALYAPIARGIRQPASAAVIGGPSFMTGDPDYLGFPYEHWIGALRKELARRGQSNDFQFVSFESYPFDDVYGDETAQVQQSARLLEASMNRLRKQHLPVVLAEFNYSAYFTEHEVDLGGALLNAETAAQFLCHGGRAAYFYGYEPNRLKQKAGSWGNHMILLQPRGQAAVAPVAAFHAMQMVSSEWMDPRGGVHQAHRVTTASRDGAGDLLSAFALQRPDGAWALLLINKDATHPAQISLRGLPSRGAEATLITYSATEYAWQSSGPNGRPTRNEPPARRTVNLDQPLAIPPWSLSVLRWNPRRS
jgi:hypothetical protein